MNLNKKIKDEAEIWLNKYGRRIKEVGEWDIASKAFIGGVKSDIAKEYWFKEFTKDQSETEKRLDEYIRRNYPYSNEELKRLNSNIS